MSHWVSWFFILSKINTIYTDRSVFLNQRIFSDEVWIKKIISSFLLRSYWFFLLLLLFFISCYHTLDTEKTEKISFQPSVSQHSMSILFARERLKRTCLDTTDLLLEQFFFLFLLLLLPSSVQMSELHNSGTITAKLCCGKSRSSSWLLSRYHFRSAQRHSAVLRSCKTN